MKKRIFSLILIFISCHGMAQVDKNSFEDFMKANEESFNNFKQENERNYSEYLRQTWEKFDQFKQDQMPQEAPKPKVVPRVPQPPIDGLEPRKAPIIKKLPTPTLEPHKVVPIPVPNLEPAVPEKTQRKLQFDFFGVQTTLLCNEDVFVRPKGYANNQIADYWEAMDKQETDGFWSSVTSQAEAYGLNGWGVYKMLEAVAMKQLGKQTDADLFCAYMLRTHGYDVKVGLRNDQPVLLMNFDCKVYRMNYISKNGKNYYVVNAGRGDIYSPDDKGDNANLLPVSLTITTPLSIGDHYENRHLVFPKGEMELDVPCNPAHKLFYNSLPVTDIESHLFAAMPICTHEALRDAFEKLSKGKTLLQFVNDMLGFVQKSFAYKTDEEQFNDEKYFYPEELFIYPYSDCEDRSALFIWLVSHFTDLDVVGLYYPGHVATAVDLSNELDGGYKVLYNHRTYTICDPTYIGASAGMCMPQFKDVIPKVLTEN